MRITEIKSKSILTPSKLGSFTLNPYVGCQHGCAYCLDGETLILMADGTTKLLKDLKVGDKIYGVRKDKNTGYYYYEITEVLAHWKSVKPAIKITTEEGIEVICSPDHRWFSTKGWKYTLGRMSGLLRRPYLTKNNAIHGIGKLMTRPKETDLYMRGYLSGIIRGDGLLKSYDYSGRRRNKDIQYQFRLALNDKEAVIRVSNYLDKFGVKTNWFKFEISNGSKVGGIRINSKKSYQKIKKLIEFNLGPEYLRGFAAGIFDAEGHGGSDSSTIRILNTDVSLLKFISKSLKKFGFRIVNDKPNKETNCKTIRILGGLEEYIRFFQTMNPAIKRKIVLEGKQVKRSFKVKEIIDLHETREMYDITTGTGTFIANGLVSHNCYATYIGKWRHPYEAWGTWVDVKMNAPEILEKELKKYLPSDIFISTVCDVYQPIEKRYKITRGCLEKLTEISTKNAIVENVDIQNWKICLLTKSDLVLRDLNLIKKIPNIEIGFSITTLDDRLASIFEPYSLRPSKRIEALKKLKERGVRTRVAINPILPYFTEKNLKEMISYFQKIKIDSLVFDNLHYIQGRVGKRLRPIYQRFGKKVLERLEYAQTLGYIDELRSTIENLMKNKNLSFETYF